MKYFYTENSSCDHQNLLYHNQSDVLRGSRTCCYVFF
jgi:hypothetical protein